MNDNNGYGTELLDDDTLARRVVIALISVAVGLMLCLAVMVLPNSSEANAETMEPEAQEELACDSEPEVVSETITLQEFMDRVKDTWGKLTTAPEDDSEDDSEADYEEGYYDEYYYDYSYDYSYSGSYTPSGYEATDTSDLLGWQGRATDGTTTYTWYPNDIGYGSIENRIPDCHYDEVGIAYDGDGYIAVSADGYEYGDVIDTPYGEAKVYDKGSGSGNIDLYTNR